MLSKKKKNIIGLIILLTTTIAWGSSFALLKNVIDVLPQTYVIAIRFFVSGAILSLIFIKKILKTNKKNIIHGIILGAILSAGYFIQTYGLKNTTPGRNAFITSTYSVMCPFLLLLIKKIKPHSYNLISAVLCVLGVGLISLSGGDQPDSGFLLGDMLTLISAIFFALQIIFIDDFQKDDNGALLPIEVLTAGTILLILSASIELPQYDISAFAITGDMIFSLCYLTIVCSLGAQMGQFYGQQLSASSNQSALILSLEAVFGTVFSVILGYETLSVQIVIGFTIVFISIIITVMRLDILKIFRRKPPVASAACAPPNNTAPTEETKSSEEPVTDNETTPEE